MGINLNNTITTIVRSFMEAIIIVTRPLLAIATSKVTLPLLAALEVTTTVVTMAAAAEEDTVVVQ